MWRRTAPGRTGPSAGLSETVSRTMTANGEPGVSSVAARPRRRRWLLRSVLALVVLLVAGTAVAWRLDLLDELLDDLDQAPSSTPSTAPSTLAPVVLGVTLPTPATPTGVAPATDDETVLRPVRVGAALVTDLADPALGKHVVVAVGTLSGDGPTYSSGTAPMVPASTTKLLTTTAALAALGPEHVFSTRVVAGQGRRDVVLVGGGDPYLMSRPLRPKEEAGVYPDRADVVDLATQTAASLRQDGVRRVHVGYDDSLFTGPPFAPTWEADYGPDEVVAPITALWVDEGRPRSGFGRVPDPADRAARVFAAALAAQGITVLGAPEQARAEADATELARADSAPLSQIVERVLDVSDNEAAEVLGHHVGLAAGGEGSFAGGVRGVEQTLRDLDVPLTGGTVYDGSGLSRANRLDPATLLALLRLAADPEHPELRAVLTGLPVAGFTGSLAYRFEDGARAGKGTVRAKTGTLTGVSGLAGVVTDRDGTPLVFAVVADKIAVADTLDARAALDRIAADLAGCACTS